MGADFRLLANDRNVQIRNRELTCSHPLNRVAQENVAGRAFPFRLARWKVLADIALGQGAVNRVGHRVHGNIRIRMALKPPAVGNIHAAERHVIARPEAMHVEPVAKADIHCLALLQNAFGPKEVLGRRDLDVVGVSRTDPNTHADRPRDFDVIGSVAAMLAVCVKNCGKAKGLRRLRPIEMTAIHRPTKAHR